MTNFDQLKLKYLDDPKKALRFWLVLAFLDLVVFGFLGLQLSLAALAEKKTKYKETSAQITLLQDKKFILMDTEATLKSVSPVLPSLYKAIPDNVDYQEFLPELVTSAANNGFVVTSLITAESLVANQALLTVQLSGNMGNVSPLIKSFEEFSRRTSVASVLLDFTEPLAKVDATLNIFFSDEKILDLVSPSSAIIDTEFLNKEFLPAHE